MSAARLCQHAVGQFSIPAARKAGVVEMLARINRVDGVISSATSRVRNQVVTADLNPSGTRVGDVCFQTREVGRIRILQLEPRAAQRRATVSAWKRIREAALSSASRTRMSR